MTARELLKALSTDQQVTLWYQNQRGFVVLKENYKGKPLTADECKIMFNSKLLDSEVTMVEPTIVTDDMGDDKVCIDILTNYVFED